MELLRDLPGHDVCIDGFGNAGHELKTPLTIIDADAELLEMDVPGNEWLTDIRCQTRRLSDLTHDLIFLSRMEEQKGDDPVTPFSFTNRAEDIARPQVSCWLNLLCLHKQYYRNAYGAEPPLLF